MGFLSRRGRAAEPDADDESLRWAEYHRDVAEADAFRRRCEAAAADRFDRPAHEDEPERQPSRRAAIETPVVAMNPAVVHNGVLAAPRVTWSAVWMRTRAVSGAVAPLGGVHPAVAPPGLPKAPPKRRRRPATRPAKEAPPDQGSS